MISIELENNKYFKVDNVYRHPSSAIDTFKENFNNVLDLTNEMKKCYIIGCDININLFVTDQSTCDYLNCISSASAL